MSTNFNWSNFEEVPKESNSSFDWSQFEETNSKPKQKEVSDNRSMLEKGFEKGTRLIGQAALGGIQRATVGYDIPAIFSRKLGIANAPQEFRQNIFNDIEQLQEQKSRGEWNQEDQEKYDNLVDLIKNPEKMKEFLPKEEKIPHFDVGGLIESGAKQFGVDISPQGADEMALRWIGFIKNPEKAADLLKNGLNLTNAKEIIKALAPTGKEAFRGIGAGSAIQYAAESEFGPVGTMIAAILGDISPSLALKTGTTALNVAKNPIQSIKTAGKTTIQTGKKLAAKGIAKFTPRNKSDLQKAIITDFREAGIQADLGTISGNNIVKWVQSTLAQSGLTGTPLEEFKKSLTSNIVSEYKKLASELGETIYQSKYEAGEALKSGLHEARDIDLSESRDLYNSARERAGSAQVFTGNVVSTIQEIEESLAPGSYKSAEQKAVLDIIDQIKKDVSTPEGGIRGAEVRALINDKIALNDAINYEVQGGTKQLLKRLVHEIDEAILTHGKSDPQFAKEWAVANKKFSEHAKLFRGKVLDQALKTQDPSQIFNKMNTPHGIEQIRKGLNVTPEGRQLFNQLSRYKLEELIGQNMVNSTTQQLNFGNFSKLLEKGQNREIVKSLLGKEGLSRLEKLQKASGTLADTAQKFLNTSRSGIQTADTAIVLNALTSIGLALAGNPWPLIQAGGLYVAAKTAAKLMADPEFLHLVEEAIIESRHPTSKAFKNTGTRLAKRIKDLEEPSIAAIQTIANE